MVHYNCSGFWPDALVNGLFLNFDCRKHTFQSELSLVKDDRYDSIPLQELRSDFKLQCLQEIVEM